MLLNHLVESDSFDDNNNKVLFVTTDFVTARTSQYNITKKNFNMYPNHNYTIKHVQYLIVTVQNICHAI